MVLKIVNDFSRRSSAEFGGCIDALSFPSMKCFNYKSKRNIRKNMN
jgi:hypothetical protein